MIQRNSLALIGAVIIDGLGGAPVEGHAVLVREDRIIAVLPEEQVPEDASRLDLAGKTLLPGLIDAHVHLLGWITGT